MTREEAMREAAMCPPGGNGPHSQLARATAGADAERARVVAWLRDEAKLCDCAARSEGECACGAWSDYKTVPVERIADAIERGDHWRKDGE